MGFIEIKIGGGDGSGLEASSISGRSIARVVFAVIVILLGLYLVWTGFFVPTTDESGSAVIGLVGAWDIFWGVCLMLGKRWTYRGGMLWSALLVLSGLYTLYSGDSDGGVAALLQGGVQAAVLYYAGPTFKE